MFSLSLIQPVFGNTVDLIINKENIDDFIHHTLPNASIGILLQDAHTGNILYEKQSDEPFPPASTTKLFTGAASLLALGTDYQYKTVIKIETTNLRQGILKGDLYIQFSGDPSLSIDDLTKLLHEIKLGDIKQIDGNIVIDNTRFQEPMYAMGWSHESLNWFFAAPITTVILNQNLIPMNINSNKPIGEKAEISFHPNEIIKTDLTQNVTTVTEEEAASRCQINVSMNDENHIFMSGCWPQKQSPSTLKISVKNPNLLAKQIILKTLVSEKIGFSGKILFGKTPTDLTIIASHSSKPFHELLKTMLQDSNNLYAESFTKTLGSEFFHKGTFQMGVVAIKETLSKSMLLNLDTLSLFDGSGLSRYNMATPRQFASLLYTMYNHKRFSKVFMGSLPVSGENGTLKGWMTSKRLQGHVYAKTGFLMNHSILAGYLIMPSKKDLIFVIMVDHVLDINLAKRFEKGLCELFLDCKGDT